MLHLFVRNQLAVSQNENKEKMHRFALEEKHIREENIRLQRKLQQEVSKSPSTYNRYKNGKHLCFTWSGLPQIEY